MDELDNKLNTTSIEIPGEWIIKKILGPTLDNIGNDFSKLYLIGRNKIIEKSKNKINNINDGKSANLRVARDVLWNGSFSNESICAEYFGGVLASSRSVDGEDDSGIYYVDIIKSMSSSQLLLHYIIYFLLNSYFKNEYKGESINVGLSDELNRIELFLNVSELAIKGIKLDIDLVVLHKNGLLNSYKSDFYKIVDNGSVGIYYIKITPTTLGIQLFTIAHNNLSRWSNYAVDDFHLFDGIEMPKYYADSLDNLIVKQHVSIPILYKPQK